MKVKTLYKIFFAVLCAIIGLFGCSVPTPDPAPAPHVPAPSQIVVSGTINADNGRSATVDFSKQNLTWYVIATKPIEGEKIEFNPSVTDPTADVNDGKFTLKLPEFGNWIILAGGFAGQPDTDYQNYVIGGMTDIITVPKSGVSNLTITASPQINGREYGSVSLSFQDASGKLRKVYMKGNHPLNNLEASFTNGSATLTCSSVLANEYPVTLLFNDAYGNTLYRCKEVIHVIQDCTTDTWSGNSTYLKSGIFTITQDMIDAYGTEIVPDTETVLFDETDDGGDWSGYAYRSNDSGVTYCGDNYCFDKNGNVYVLKIDVGGIGFSISSNQYRTQNNTVNDSADSLSYITFDRKTNKMYGYVSDYYTIGVIDVSAEYSVTVTRYSFEDGSDASVRPFAVYDGIAYIPTKQIDEDDETQTKIVLLIVDMNGAVYKEDEDTSDYIYDVDSQNVTIIDIENPSNGIEFGKNAEITDCLYQDGCVYMLLRESRTYWDAEDVNMYSRGAVIKYDCFDGSIKTLGWSDYKIETTSINNMYLVNENNNLVYSNENHTTPFLLSKNNVFSTDFNPTKLCGDLFPTVYAPNSANGTIDAQHFYGPRKFVAIKPKKLVIADDGAAIYTDNDALTFKNVNRIITVDLENFAISEINSSNASFNDDFDVLKTYYNIADLGASGFNPGNVYWDKDNDYESVVNLYFAIPKADN